MNQPTVEQRTAAERVRQVREEGETAIDEVYGHYLKKHRRDYYVHDLETLADAWLAQPETITRPNGS